MGKLFRLPYFGKSFFQQQQALFWLSGQEILAVFGKKRKKYSFSFDTGFEEGGVADFEKARATLTKLCEENDFSFRSPWHSQKATIFLPTGVSPLERSIVRKVFQSVGFSQVNLRRYATAFRGFLAKQNEEKGVFVYMGQATSEVGIFSASHQQSLRIPFSLKEIQEYIASYFREKHFFEISQEACSQIYQELGKQQEKFSLVVRGRNTRTSEIETKAVAFTHVESLFLVLKQKVMQEVTSVMNDPLFREVHPEKWTVLGDTFFPFCAHEAAEAKVLLLQSEFDLMQGIEWL